MGRPDFTPEPSTVFKGVMRDVDANLRQVAGGLVDAGLVTKDLHGGDIILLHDGLELGPDEPRPALDRAYVTDLVLSETARLGLKAVTVGSLLTRRAPKRTRWLR